LLFEFVNEVGAAKKQTGEKCSQSQGETYELGDGGDDETNGERQE
jgi:hypothetical protein